MDIKFFFLFSLRSVTKCYIIFYQMHFSFTAAFKLFNRIHNIVILIQEHHIKFT